MASNCAPSPVEGLAYPTVMQQTVTRIAWPIHVLLIEDDPEAAELVRIRLSTDADRTFNVEWRRSLLDGMGRLVDPGIDIVLLDLGMPELRGYQSYQAIALVAGTNIPIVILTADDSRLTRDLIMEFGAADYLVKSQCTPDQLMQALHKALLGRSA
jgi:DNA-binding response OmpR family regulator